jgi:hypothetical protein
LGVTCEILPPVSRRSAARSPGAAKPGLSDRADRTRTAAATGAAADPGRRRARSQALVPLSGGWSASPLRIALFADPAALPGVAPGSTPFLAQHLVQEWPGPAWRPDIDRAAEAYRRTERRPAPGADLVPPV